MIAKTGKIHDIHKNSEILVESIDQNGTLPIHLGERGVYNGRIELQWSRRLCEMITVFDASYGEDFRQARFGANSDQY